MAKNKPSRERHQKPDFQKAQRMLFRSLHRMMTECHLDDPVFCTVLLQSVSSAVITEIVGSRRLHEEGGIDKVIAHATEVLAGHLRRDLGERLAHEQAQVRH